MSREFFRVTRADLRMLGLLGAAFGILYAGYVVLNVRDRLPGLKAYRAGIPVGMVPGDSDVFTEHPITYAGRKMTARYYGGWPDGPAGSTSYLVLVNRDGIVEAAFSSEHPDGRAWMREHLDLTVKP